MAVIPPMRVLAVAFFFTLMLGLATAVAFYVVGGRVALAGPYVLVTLGQWPWIYALEMLLVVGLGFLLGLYVGDRQTFRWLAGVVVIAWLGEYVVLALRVLADELNPVSSAYFWILATAGPIQPVSALGGVWLGRLFARRRAAA